MQIKFLTGRDPKADQIVAQADLLQQWYKSIENSQIKFIKNANIEFIDYDISDYPDQDKIKKAIMTSCGYTEARYLEMYDSIAERIRVMELVITTENY